MKTTYLIRAVLICALWITQHIGNAQCQVEISTLTPTICVGETAVLSAQTVPGVLSTFAAGNGQDGNMFDIVALNDIIITSFAGHPNGSSIFEIYYKEGTHVGSETTPEDWTFVGSAYAEYAGSGVPTTIPIGVNLSMDAGESYGFYITTIDVGVNYTNGTALGNVYVENSDLQILEGRGKGYPFGSTFTPRIWNGIVNYEYQNTDFLWSTGETTPTIEVTPAPGINTFSVEADVGNCTADASVEIAVDGIALSQDPLQIITSVCPVEINNIPTATNSCTGTIYGETEDPLYYEGEGEYTVVWTFQNGLGGEVTQEQIIIIEADESAPVPNITNLPKLSGECMVDALPPSAYDNCLGTIYATTEQPMEYTEIGTYTISWSYVDHVGNLTVQEQEVEVLPDTAPIPNQTSLPDIIRECYYSYYEGEPRKVKSLGVAKSVSVQVSSPANVPTAYDACTFQTIYGTTEDPLEYFDAGSYVVTWTYDEGDGDVTTQTQNITIYDEEAPEPKYEELEPIVSACAIELEAPLAYDYCRGEIEATTVDPVDYNIEGSYIVNWVYDDENGNTVSQQQSVQITSDDEGPVPHEESLEAIVENCSFEFEVLPTAEDCEGTIIASTQDPLLYDEPGLYTVTWKYRDQNGNNTFQEQTVEIYDEDGPVPDEEGLEYLISSCPIEITEFPTATDDCAGTIVGTTDDPLIYSSADRYIITWVFDDGNGNVTEQEQGVRINSSDPEPNDAGIDGILYWEVDCYMPFEDIVALYGAPTATDDCDNQIEGIVNGGVSNDHRSSYLVDWSYFSPSGGLSSQPMYIIINDFNEGPDPDIPSLADINKECEATLSIPTATDGCDGLITATTDGDTYFDIAGTYLVTWQYEDAEGNITDQTQNVTVVDSDSPVPDNATLSDVNVECFYSAIPPTSTDNCKGTITATTDDPMTYDTEGAYVITWVYDDGSGNTDSQDQNVNILADATDPEPSNETLSDVVSECAITLSAPTAIDGCVGVISGTTDDPVDYSTPGNYVVTWEFDDGSGNTVTQNQNVEIITDDIGPVPLIAELPTLSGECSVVVSSAPRGEDCSGIIIATTSDPLEYSTPGNYSINWTYEDDLGNTSTQSQAIEVVADASLPIPQKTTLPTLTASCSLTLTDIPTANDTCEGVITATTDDPMTYDTEGAYVITWEYDDGNGNVAEQTQNVVIEDNEAPVTDLNVLVKVVGDCSVTVDATPTATDNCDGEISGTTDDPLSYDMGGNYVVTWEFTDAAGNVSTQIQNVQVIDTVPVPVEASLSQIVADCSVEVTAIPTALDDCDGTLDATTTEPLVYDESGTYTITWLYEDGSGNEVTQTQKVIVSDNVDPVPNIENLPELTADCSVSITDIPTATDNCGGSLSATTDDPTEYDMAGSYSVSWTFDDGNGNVISQKQNVVVSDETAPTFTCPTDITVCGDDLGSIALTGLDDNCGVASVDYELTGATRANGEDDASAETFNAGDTFVTYLVEDVNGNTAECSFTVSIQNEFEVEVDLDESGVLSTAASGTYQWVNCTDNSDIEGETNASFTPSGEGSFAVRVSSGSCSVMSSCIDILSVLKVHDQSLSNVNVYPIPAVDKLNIDLGESAFEGTIRVMDVSGHLLSAHQIDQQQGLELDVSTFRVGVYFLSIEGKSETKLIRFVKR